MSPHEFLKSLGTECTPHSNKTFYEHLTNVENILRICGQPEYVCAAGLFHSVYGTVYFKQKTISDREAVKALIGDKAEQLVYLFCNAHRPYCWFTGNDLVLKNGTFVRIDNQTMQDLRMIEGANLLDQQMGVDLITNFYADRTRDEN